MDSIKKSICHKFRHYSCLFGVEDLQYLSSSNHMHLYFNKMMMSYDYGAVFCWLKRLKKLSIKKYNNSVNTSYYQNLAHVSFIVHMLYFKVLYSTFGSILVFAF